MIEKLLQWWRNRRKLYKANDSSADDATQPDVYTREQMEHAYRLGYTDGRRDGLSIAREQATKSLKEILWQQNRRKKTKPTSLQETESQS